MKKIFFFLILVALVSCKPEPKQEPQTEVYTGPNVHGMAILSQQDIMVLYQAGYMKALANVNNPGTLRERWTEDSLLFIPKIQPLFRK